MGELRPLLDRLGANVSARQLSLLPDIPPFASFDGSHKLPRVIGMVGKMHSGKDTVGKYLRAKYGYREVKFAKPLKNMIRTYLNMCGVDPDTQERMIEGDLKEVPTHHFGGVAPRVAMQTLGTDWGRNMIDKDLWVRPLVRAIDTSLHMSVVTDVRFQNELDAISDRGLTLKIVRYSGRQTNRDLIEHESERYIDDLHTDKYVNNDSTIEYLYNQVDACLANWAKEVS